MRAIRPSETSAQAQAAGAINVYALKEEGEAGAAAFLRASLALPPTATSRYADPQPALFSFNSTYGAGDTCRGFGRVIGVDYGLVIPTTARRCAPAPISPTQTPAWKVGTVCSNAAAEAGIPATRPGRR